jgi:hypothetical protein
MERHCRVGFRKAEENFDRDKLTAGDPEFLSLHDPVELRQGVLDRWSFLDLSYRTSLYWSSNIQFKGYLTRSDTRRVLELYDSLRRVSPDSSNRAAPLTSPADNDAVTRPLLPLSPKHVRQDVNLRSAAFYELAGQADYE